MQDPEEMEPIEAPQEIVIPTDWGAIVSALLVLLGGGYVLGWHGILSPDPGDGYISLKSFAASFMLAVLTLPVLIILLGERSVRFRRTPEALLVQRLRLVGGGVAHEVQYEWEKVERSHLPTLIQCSFRSTLASTSCSRRQT